MKILHVELARFGNERTVLSCYSNDKGWVEALAPFDMQETAAVIAQRSNTVDWICVEEGGVSRTLIDLLYKMDVKNLLTSPPHLSNRRRYDDRGERR